MSVFTAPADTEVCTTPLPWPADLAAAVRAYVAGRDYAWLDPAGEGWPYGLVAADPLATVTQFAGQAAELRVHGVLIEQDRSGWGLLRRALRRFAASVPRDGVVPAWIGYIGYEQARLLEKLPATTRNEPPIPAMRLALFEEAVVLDAAARRATLHVAPIRARSASEGACRTDPASRAKRCAARWRAEPAAAAVLPRARVRVEQPRAEVERAVARAIEYIRAGDIYQVNLAHRLALEPIADALESYLRLRTVNPAPFGGVLHWADGAVLSASPERMLTVRGRRLWTSPIKGTRASGPDALRELLTSEKDAAELAMIVDLHRNDLGKVSTIGSVRVEAARRVEAHGHVVHTLADVVGTLREGCTALDALEAGFPAGSISGVPKVRAMQIIDELEVLARGAYTGALLHVDPHGDLTAAVGIRLVQVRDRVGYLHVGGGIVAESDPAGEYEETLAKARGICDALAGPPWEG